jgi:hypothetical protein
MGNTEAQRAQRRGEEKRGREERGREEKGREEFVSRNLGTVRAFYARKAVF